RASRPSRGSRRAGRPRGRLGQAGAAAGYRRRRRRSWRRNVIGDTPLPSTVGPELGPVSLARHLAISLSLFPVVNLTERPGAACEPRRPGTFLPEIVREVST